MKMLQHICLYGLMAGLALANSVATAATNEEIEAARLKGIEFLKSQQQTDGTWEFASYKTGITALATLALIENGISVTDPAIEKGYRYVKRQADDCKNTYEISLSILLLARMGDRLDRNTIRTLGARLLAGQNKGGGWGYTCPAVDASVLGNLKKLDRQDGEGDNSCTQFGVLGLWVASRYGVPIEQAMTEVAGRFLDDQNEDGGWSYAPATPDKPAVTSSSMTCAGLFSLTVARATRIRAAQKDSSSTGGESRGEKATLLSDPAYAKGFAKVGVFAKTIGPGSPKYFMWSVERLGVLLGLEKLGEADWFKQGSDALVKSQNMDGSWSAAKEVTSDTAFAILFLRKANLGSDISRLLEGEPSQQFAVIAGSETKRFETLDDAIKAAAPGSIVRLDGNGPFKAGHLTLSKDITLQAGFGYEPVLEFQVGLKPDGLRYRPEKDVDGRDMFKITGGKVTMEGLKLQFDPPVTSTPLPWKIIQLTGGNLRLLNCQLSEGNRRGATGVVINGPGSLYARNTVFVGSKAAVEIVGAQDAQRATFENCLIYTTTAVQIGNDPESKQLADAHLGFHHTNVQCSELIAAPNLKGEIAVVAMETLFKCDALSLTLLPTPTGKEGRRWTGKDNVYNFTNWLGSGGKKSPTVTDVKSFEKFWGDTETGGQKTIIAWQNPRKNGGFAHATNVSDWDLAERSELALNLSRAGIQTAMVGPGDGFTRYREDFRYNAWKAGVTAPDGVPAP